MGTPLTLFLAGHVKCWMMIATAQVVFFFNCIMFMAGSSFPILFLSRTIGGVGSTFLQSGAIAMLDSLYPSSERGNRFVMVYFCGGFGLTMGPLIGGSLSSDGSFIPCLLAALTLAGAFALVMMFLRDNEAEFTKMEPLAPHVRDQQTLLSLASLVLVSSTVAFSEVILPLHLNVAFATTASALGGLLMIAAIAFIFVANVAALVSEKINRNRMMGAGLAVNGVAFLALFSPESLAVEVVPVMLLGCSASVVYTGVFLRMVDSVGQGDARSPALQQVSVPSQTPRTPQSLSRHRVLAAFAAASSRRQSRVGCRCPEHSARGAHAARAGWSRVRWLSWADWNAADVEMKCAAGFRVAQRWRIPGACCAGRVCASLWARGSGLYIRHAGHCGGCCHWVVRQANCFLGRRAHSERLSSR